MRTRLASDISCFRAMAMAFPRAWSDGSSAAPLAGRIRLHKATAPEKIVNPSTARRPRGASAESSNCHQRRVAVFDVAIDEQKNDAGKEAERQHRRKPGRGQPLAGEGGRPIENAAGGKKADDKESQEAGLDQRHRLDEREEQGNEGDEQRRPPCAIEPPCKTARSDEQDQAEQAREKMRALKDREAGRSPTGKPGFRPASASRWKKPALRREQAPEWPGAAGVSRPPTRRRLDAAGRR